MDECLHLQRLCEDLAWGVPEERAEAWETLTRQHGLWRGARAALRDPAAGLPVLDQCFDDLRGKGTLEYLRRGRSPREAARLRGSAVRFVASAALACGVRLARTVGVSPRRVDRWARRALSLAARKGAYAPAENLRSESEAEDVRLWLLAVSAGELSVHAWTVLDAAWSLLDAHPSTAEGRRRLPVLMKHGDEGHVATLWLQRLDRGAPRFFQPLLTAFAPIGQEMRDAVNQAWDGVRARYPRLEFGVVGWWLSDLAPGRGADGASLQASAETGLVLLARDLPCDPACAITATVDAEGRLGCVTGVLEAAAPKLRAALELQGRHGPARVVVAPGTLPSPSARIDWEDRGVEIVGAENLEDACAQVSGLATSVSEYLRGLVALPGRAQPAFLGSRSLDDLFVPPQVVARTNGARRHWAEEMHQIRHAVLFGEPGQGKSTLVWMTVASLARAALEEMYQQRTPVRDLPLPVRVRAADVASRGLHDAVRVDLERAGGSAALVSHVLASLTSEQCWLFLDGLDEVPEPHRLAESLAPLRGAACRLVATSRPTGHDPVALPLDHVAEYDLAPLTPPERHRLVQRWYANNPSRAAAVLRLIEANAALREMTTNHLLLTLTCATAERHALDDAPIRRVGLYRLMIQDLVRGAWRGDARGGADLHGALDLWLLRGIAWALFRRDPARAAFCDEELFDALEQHCAGRMNWHDALERFTRTGLLLRPGDGQWMFLHRTFLEFLAAEHVAETANPVRTVSRYLWHRDERGEVRWSSAAGEMITLLAGCLADPRALLERLIAEERAHPDPFHRPLELARRCLAEVADRDRFADLDTKPEPAPASRDSDELIDELHDSKWRVREAAALELGQVGDVEAISPLQEVLEQDPDEYVRRAAALALGDLGGDEVFGSLLRALRRPPSIVQQAAARSLRRLGRLSELEPFLDILKDPRRWEAARTAPRLLGELGSPHAVAPLVVAMGDDRSVVRRDAADALGTLGRECITAALGEPGRQWATRVLIHSFADPEWRVRAAVARALGKIGGDEAIEALLARLDEQSRHVRQAAALALSDLGAERAIQPILGAIREGLLDLTKLVDHDAFRRLMHDRRVEATPVATAPRPRRGWWGRLMRFITGAGRR